MSESEQNDSDNISLIYPQLLSPLRYTKVLIQLGYEPLKAYPGHHLLSIFNVSERKMRYPWIGGYAYNMYEIRDLIYILSTGFMARFEADIFNTALEKTTQNYICESLKSADKDSEDAVEECSWIEFRGIFVQLSIFRLSEVVVTYPLKEDPTREFNYGTFLRPLSMGRRLEQPTRVVDSSCSPARAGDFDVRRRRLRFDPVMSGASHRTGDFGEWLDCHGAGTYDFLPDVRRRPLRFDLVMSGARHRASQAAPVHRPVWTTNHS